MVFATGRLGWWVQPKTPRNDAHLAYLRRLFEQNGLVSMSLFDPSLGRRARSLDIYTSLPVDFAITAAGRPRAHG